MRLAVIPARGGSKRIPRKNVRPFCGKPMIAWAIEAAKNAGCMDRVVVSTDDAEIASVARAHGAEVPFIRPAALSGDQTATPPVVAHAVRHFQLAGMEVTHVCCVYATAPFTRAQDLQRAFKELTASGSDFVFTVAAFAAPVQRALRITTGGRVEPFQPEHRLTRSQDLEPAYHDAGQFYWGRAEAWLEERPVFGHGSVPLVLPRYRVQDIDTEDDWRRAELLFRVLAETDAD